MSQAISGALGFPGVGLRPLRATGSPEFHPEPIDPPPRDPAVPRLAVEPEIELLRQGGGAADGDRRPSGDRLRIVQSMTEAPLRRTILPAFNVR